MEDIEVLRSIPGVKVVVTDGKLSWEEMPAFYDSIDYLVILSNKEGGPMPVKEAILRRIPVIAPNVGWCWEYPCIRYEGIKELEQIVRKLAPDLRSEWIAACQKLIRVCRGEQEKEDGRYGRVPLRDSEEVGAFVRP